RGRDRGRPVPPFDLGAIHPDVQPSTGGNRFDRKRLAGPDDDRVRAGIGAQHVQGLPRRNADPSALAGRKAPEAVVAAEPAALLVEDLALGLLDAVAPQEVTVVAAPEKTGLLALRTPRGCESGAAGLGPRLLLGLLAQREPNPVEQARVEAGEHVRLVLPRIVAAGQQAPAAMLDDPCVVPGREARGSGTLREREELREAKAAVAANARIRSLAAGVAAHERGHDRPAKLLAQIERHVWETERVASLARRDHGFRRATGTLRVRRRRIDPEPQRDPDRLRARAQERNGAVDTATHRHRDAAGIRLSPKHLTERVSEGVRDKRLARHRRRLKQGQAAERALEPVCVCVDDAVALDRQPNERYLAVARGIPKDLDHTVRLAAPTRTGHPRP